ncbi:hypothetical protein TraAM80_09582 [Trypanosoma rangeli]|uniref:Uncharacterized protein n=1 Tax=Trypanosoma rangeli TaxID=5698 RepID=A0A3R7M033_TRYRA|nr:uncharacterized protein TraAM80_09582 [Trypanosoma rangeli]RNE96899.1 hypothetical protein TraAM80_09582 [Trypanosoma rangeli]|eukprot:RNE96899.1 hypothetical protein TraAM80_09582 [Trypanosoma rangeli]
MRCVCYLLLRRVWARPCAVGGAATSGTSGGEWRRSASVASARGGVHRRCGGSCVRPVSAAGLRREVVLTPATLLRRLEAVFPPAPLATAPPKGATCRGGLSEADEERPPVFSGGLAGVPGGVRACCHPVPWERVVLRRVGQAPACDVGRQHLPVLLHTAAAVYDVLVPAPFLFLPGAACVDAGDAADATCLRPCRDRTLLSLKRRRGAEVRSVWCQRVGVLHHIPGLPDPSAPALTLREYVDFMQLFSQPVEGGPAQCMAACGLNNRDAVDHGVRRRLGDAKRDGTHGRCGPGAECPALNGGVGVWIVDPWRGSVFFAVRYRVGAEHYEWVRRPQHAFSQGGRSAPAGAATSAPPEAKVVFSSGVRKGPGASSFAWARASVRQAMLEPSTSHARSTPASQQPTRQGKRREEDVLSTVLYYCVAGAALTAAERAAFLAQLLGEAGARDALRFGGAHSSLPSVQRVCSPWRGGARARRGRRGVGAREEKGRGGDGVARLAKVWSPLPRSARPLRGRQVLADAAALAEAMKYGVLHLLL